LTRGRPKTNQPNSQNSLGRYASGRGSYQTGSGFNRRGGSGRGNNTNRNSKYCYFNSKDIDKRNAGKESRRTSPAEMLRDEHTGREFTLWRKNIFHKTTTKNMDLTQPELILVQSISQELQPFPNKIQVFRAG
jgi:hypothetical protein